MKNYNNSKLPLKGYVVIEDLDGNVLVEKENMIVESGRSFIRDLVYKQVSGVADTRKFSYIQLGSDGTASYSGMTDLNAHIAAIDDISIDTTTTLVWSEVQTAYSSGTTLPTTAITGDLFFNTVNTKLYTATGTDTWDSGELIDSSTILPEIIDEIHGDYYFNTRNNKLYYASYILENLPDSLPLGLKISIDLNGNASARDPARELGIFLEDSTVIPAESLVLGGFYRISSVGTTTDWNTIFGTTGVTYATGDTGIVEATGSGNGSAKLVALFSRIVFDPLPITEGFKYRLTYYIYF